MTDKRGTISRAKLQRMSRDCSCAQQRSVEEPGLSRFSYDHGSLLIYDTNNKCDLLFENNGERARGQAARLLWQLSPGVVQELIYGYTMARAAGLLGDDQTSDEAAKHVLLLADYTSPADDKEMISQGRIHLEELRVKLHREHQWGKLQ